MTIPDVGGLGIRWSPTGDRLSLNGGPAPGTLRIVRTTGDTIDLALSGGQAAWSSDRRVDHMDRSHRGARGARADGSDRATVAAAPYSHSIWRPGTHELLVLEPSLLRYDADTALLSPFSVAPTNYAKAYSWSPDGSRRWRGRRRWMAYSRRASSSTTSTEVRPRPSRPCSRKRPTRPRPRPFESPSWSPDGGSVIAAEFDGSWATGVSLSQPTMRVFPSNGSSAGMTVTPRLGPPGPPALTRVHQTLWSPDSRHVLVQEEVVTFVGMTLFQYPVVVASIAGDLFREVGGSLHFPGEINWWPVVGVPGDGGACVLAAQATPVEPPPTATRPQFTG